ncbi:MAG: zinc ABC transporter substrate-binding protein [Candidatus Carbobacillus altaicus]|nr:zinc ABC transporter substrate-binding protein [Candidatus Carbobacillus altaicus]
MHKWRVLSVWMLMMVMLVSLSACGGGSEQTSDINASHATKQSEGTTQTEPEDTSAKLKVVASIYPLYDLARQIGGEWVEAEQLVPFGAESHDFEPSPGDLKKLSDADILFIVGIGLEGWIDKAKENISPVKTNVVEVNEGIALLPGHTYSHGDAHADDDHATADEHADDDAHAHATTYDPHIWLSIANAKIIGQHIVDALSARDPEHKTDFEANYNKLVAALDTLDQDFRADLNDATTKQFVVSHKAFAYLARDYGLEQTSISGLSPSAEPSQKDMVAIIDEIRTKNIKYIGFEDLVESKVAKTIQAETGTKAVQLSPLENITKEQWEQGVHFQDVFKKNLDTLLIMLGAREG